MYDIKLLKLFFVINIVLVKIGLGRNGLFGF